MDTVYEVRISVCNGIGYNGLPPSFHRTKGGAEREAAQKLVEYAEYDPEAKVLVREVKE